MKNKISDLRDHLFLTLEKLINPEEGETMDVSKAQVVADIGKVIVDSAKVEVMAMKALGITLEDSKNDFLQLKPAEE